MFLFLFVFCFFVFLLILILIPLYFPSSLFLFYHFSFLSYPFLTFLFPSSLFFYHFPLLISPFLLLFSPLLPSSYFHYPFFPFSSLPPFSSYIISSFLSFFLFFSPLLPSPYFHYPFFPSSLFLLYNFLILISPFLLIFPPLLPSLSFHPCVLSSLPSLFSVRSCQRSKMSDYYFLSPYLLRSTRWRRNDYHGCLFCEVRRSRNNRLPLFRVREFA